MRAPPPPLQTTLLTHYGALKLKNPSIRTLKLNGPFIFFSSNFQAFGRRYKLSILLNFLIFFEFSSFWSLKWSSKSSILVNIILIFKIHSKEILHFTNLPRRRAELQYRLPRVFFYHFKLAKCTQKSVSP